MNTVKPVILPAEPIMGSYRTGSLRHISAVKIASILGFMPNVVDDFPKVTRSWSFTVDSVYCAVWDYKGSDNRGVFSTCGPRHVLRSIFGDHATD